MGQSPSNEEVTAALSGESIGGCPVLLKGLECPVPKSAKSDTCHVPRQVQTMLDVLDVDADGQVHISVDTLRP